jgi:hypothetical protein
MRSLLCLLLGHRLGPRARVIGIELRRCARCGRTGLACERTRYKSHDVASIRYPDRLADVSWQDLPARKPSEVSTWSKLAEFGLAGEVCEAIVRTHPVPERLLRALSGSGTGSPFSTERANGRGGIRLCEDD